MATDLAYRMAKVVERRSRALSEPIVAGGCLVVRTGVDGLEALLVHRPKYDDWSLPKGKRDPGEHVILTAIREVEEETGVRVRLNQPLPHRQYEVAGVPKVVYFWRATPVSVEEFEPGSEVDEIAWLRIW